MKFYQLFLLILFSITILGCRSENRDNSRVYVEGKISGNNLNFPSIRIVLEDEGQLIAEVIPQDNGQFILSGPLLTDTFSLGINKKIKSFSASKSGCELTSDSLKITFPAGITYITFNEIILE